MFGMLLNLALMGSAIAEVPSNNGDTVECKLNITRVFKSADEKKTARKTDVFDFYFDSNSKSRTQEYSIHKITVSVSSVRAKNSIVVRVVDAQMSEVKFTSELVLAPGGAFSDQVVQFYDDWEMYDPVRLSCISKLASQVSQPQVNESKQKNLSQPKQTSRPPANAETSSVIQND